jgi:hypothetical protein
MERAYHTLLERIDGQWCIAFGDYSRKTVQAELEDYREHGIRKKDLKIITTSARQYAIDREVTALNG